MTILDIIYAYGHENILCTHNTTMELTKKNFLTKKGNCILGINSSKSCKSLNPILKEAIKKGEKLKVTIKVENLFDFFYGYGNEKLILSDEDDIVFRKSNFICNRTILIKCTKSSSELNPKLIEKLKFSEAKITVLFERSANE
jgi:hypothetical protein